MLITESTYEKNYEFDFLRQKQTLFFRRYFHFNNDYKYTVYIDNDVYIYPTANSLPKIKGLMNVREPEEIHQIFREVNNLNNSYGYYNSG